MSGVVILPGSIILREVGDILYGDYIGARVIQAFYFINPY